ncbi:hypothetical protein GPNCGGLF_LOCUS4034 [Methylorubrum aminovorans]
MGSGRQPNGIGYGVEASDDPVPWRLQLWLGSVLALVERATDLAASTLSAKRLNLDRQLGAILATPSGCAATRELQAKIGRARDQLLDFLDHPGRVAVTNNGCERALRPAVVQRKVTNGYRASWAANGKAAVRTVADTARLTGDTAFGSILKTIRPQIRLLRALVITTAQLAKFELSRKTRYSQINSTRTFGYTSSSV